MWICRLIYLHATRSTSAEVPYVALKKTYNNWVSSLLLTLNLCCTLVALQQRLLRLMHRMAFGLLLLRCHGRALQASALGRQRRE